MAQPIYNQTPAEEIEKRREREQLEARADETREQAKKAVDATGERLGDSAERAGTQALGALEERKNQLASSIDEIGDAFDSAAQSLKQKQHEQLADYGRRFARGIHDASDAIRQRSPSELWQDTSEFARRRPEVVVGGMFAAGLALSRFFKATERQNQ